MPPTSRCTTRPPPRCACRHAAGRAATWCSTTGWPTAAERGWPRQTSTCTARTRLIWNGACAPSSRSRTGRRGAASIPADWARSRTCRCPCPASSIPTATPDSVTARTCRRTCDAHSTAMWSGATHCSRASRTGSPRWRCSSGSTHCAPHRRRPASACSFRRERSTAACAPRWRPCCRAASAARTMSSKYPCSINARCSHSCAPAGSASPTTTSPSPSASRCWNPCTRAARSTRTASATTASCCRRATA